MNPQQKEKNLKNIEAIRLRPFWEDFENTLPESLGWHPRIRAEELNQNRTAAILRCAKTGILPRHLWNFVSSKQTNTDTTRSSTTAFPQVVVLSEAAKYFAPPGLEILELKSEKAKEVWRSIISRPPSTEQVIDNDLISRSSTPFEQSIDQSAENSSVRSAHIMSNTPSSAGSEEYRTESSPSSYSTRISSQQTQPSIESSHELSSLSNHTQLVASQPDDQELQLVEGSIGLNARASSSRSRKSPTSAASDSMLQQSVENLHTIHEGSGGVSASLTSANQDPVCHELMQFKKRESALAKQESALEQERTKLRNEITSRTPKMLEGISADKRTEQHLLEERNQLRISQEAGLALQQSQIREIEQLHQAFSEKLDQNKARFAELQEIKSRLKQNHDELTLLQTRKRKRQEWLDEYAPRASADPSPADIEVAGQGREPKRMHVRGTPVTTGALQPPTVIDLTSAVQDLSSKGHSVSLDTSSANTTYTNLSGYKHQMPGTQMQSSVPHMPSQYFDPYYNTSHTFQPTYFPLSQSEGLLSMSRYHAQGQGQFGL